MSTDFEALCVEGSESQEICDLYAVSEKDVNGRGENKNNSKAVSSRVFYSAFFSILNSISTPAGLFSLIISL